MATQQLGELLRGARESKQWSITEAAAMLGTTKSHLFELEQGRSSNPTLRLIAAMVIVYGVRPEAVIATAIPATTIEERTGG